MKLIFCFLMFSLSICAQEVELTTTGTSSRLLSQASECGGWGHMLLKKEAEDKATILANRMCWGEAEQVSEFEYQTECTVHPYSGADMEIVKAKGTFRCLPSPKNNQLQCHPPTRLCGNRCCWPQY